MNNEEFDRVWRLLGSLFPAATAKKSHVDIAVWRRGLENYSMAAVADSVMEYARNNKYFPDLADITKGLQAEADEDDEDFDAVIINLAKMIARAKGIEPPDFETKDDALAWARGLEART